MACGAVARSVTVKPTGCGCDPHSRRWNIYLNLYFHLFALVSRLSAALSSATQHAMPPEFGRKWGTECLNTRFPLPTLLCTGYSVKLIWFINGIRINRHWLASKSQHLCIIGSLIEIFDMNDTPFLRPYTFTNTILETLFFLIFF